MLRKIQDYTIHIIVALIIFIIGFIILVKAVPKPQFEYERYLKAQQELIECVGNEQIFIDASQIHQSYLAFDWVDLKEKYDQIRNGHSCDVNHVVSSYSQVQEMALRVVEESQAFFNIEDVQVVNAVYTSDAKFSALLDHPQEYLFFVTNKDLSQMVAYLIYPNKNGYEVFPLWDIEKSSDIEYTQKQVQSLMIIYSEIKK